MAAPSNAPVIVVKRKKIVAGGGHHGGAWKVAYADFVTAMMAFFMLMWLLGATTEKQRKGIADYFNPTVPLVRASGGGSGAFGGDSVFSEQALTQSGTGAAQARPSDERQARGSTGVDTSESAADGAAPEAELEETRRRLQGIGGESMVAEMLRRHVVTRLSDEGLVIELFETEDAPLFDGSDTATPLLSELLETIVPVLELVENGIAVEAHAQAVPVVRREDPTWDQSTRRANAVRVSLMETGFDEDRLTRVTGHADRKPVTANPMARRNSRVEIIVLRNGV